ncbi:MAG: GDP-mannose 4,6-dehydratase, partial [Flavobacteriaceae bacterium]|nr:GDP-mannose 4,6-dehydratase [Flavobacteriaceae bacterium]
EHLLSKGVEVEGITRYCSHLIGSWNIEGIWEKLALSYNIHIETKEDVQDIIKDSEYDYIFHLASEQFLSPSWILTANVIGTANLLEAVHNSEREQGSHPVIVIVGCGEMYGIPQQVTEPGIMSNKLSFKLPITENFPLNPVSTYAVSKAAQDMLGFQYYKEYGMKIVRARLFDIAGPRCHQSLLPSDIAKQMTELEKGRNEPEIKVASLEYTRDYTDVRDAARALWLAATKCKYGEAYNICSGKGRTVQQIIDILRMQSTAQFEVVQDRTMMHPNDIIALVGDCTKFYKRTGWKPEIGFAQSMGDMLEWWRGKI